MFVFALISVCCLCFDGCVVGVDCFLVLMIVYWFDVLLLWFIICLGLVFCFVCLVAGLLLLVYWCLRFGITCYFVWVDLLLGGGDVLRVCLLFNLVFVVFRLRVFAFRWGSVVNSVVYDVALDRLFCVWLLIWLLVIV